MTDESLNLPRAVAEPYYCGCDRVPCKCPDWCVKLDGQHYIRGQRDACKNIAAAMNTAFDLSRTPQPDKAGVGGVSQSAITLAVLRAYDALTPMQGEQLDFYLARVRQHATDQLTTPPPTGAGEGFVVVPREPTDGLLMSMAIRSDHALGCPGYYDQPIFGGEGVGHAKRLAATIITMRQLHEEVVGAGFYKPEREDDYATLAAPTPPATAQEDGRDAPSKTGRYFCDGPNGHFYMDDLAEAREAVNIIDPSFDDWTITDLHDAAMLTSPDSGKEG